MLIELTISYQHPC